MLSILYFDFTFEKHQIHVPTLLGTVALRLIHGQIFSLQTSSSGKNVTAFVTFEIFVEYRGIQLHLVEKGFSWSCVKP